MKHLGRKRPLTVVALGAIRHARRGACGKHRRLPGGHAQPPRRANFRRAGPVAHGVSVTAWAAHAAGTHKRYSFEGRPGRNCPPRFYCVVHMIWNLRVRSQPYIVRQRFSRAILEAPPASPKAPESHYLSNNIIPFVCRVALFTGFPRVPRDQCISRRLLFPPHERRHLLVQHLLSGSEVRNKARSLVVSPSFRRIGSSELASRR